MLKDIEAAEALGNYRLRLRFEDGVEGEIDLAPVLSFRGVFEPLKDPAYFARVRVDPELGSVSWPNGADLDPDLLYARLTGTPLLSGSYFPNASRTRANSAPAPPGVTVASSAVQYAASDKSEVDR